MNKFKKILYVKIDVYKIITMGLDFNSVRKKRIFPDLDSYFIFFCTVDRKSVFWKYLG